MSTMTKIEAAEWVREQDEQSEIDSDDLLAAYRALMGREPEQEDYDLGLWSVVVTEASMV